MTRQYPHRALVLGHLFVGRARQGGGAPVIDTGHTWAVDGWDAGCWVVRLPRGPGGGVVVGWRTRKHIRPPRRLPRVPVLGLLFRGRP
jgi:hypothetical protein